MMNDPEGYSSLAILKPALAALTATFFSRYLRVIRLSEPLWRTTKVGPVHDGAAGFDVGGEQLGLHVELGLVVERPHDDIARQPHRPRAVVVGPQVRIRVGLLLEQRLCEATVRLIEIDEIAAGRDGFFGDRGGAGRLVDLDGLGAAAGLTTRSTGVGSLWPAGITSPYGALVCPAWIELTVFCRSSPRPSTGTLRSARAR